MNKTFSEILQALPSIKDACRGISETLLTNLVMIGEIPAPTFGEADRVHFLQRRFSECGLQNCSTDEMDNAFGIMSGNDGKKSILVVAHTDTVFPANLDHTISLRADRVKGLGVADNSLGLAVLATLPSLFDVLGLKFDSNLILMGASRSLGRGNLQGLRFFLDNQKLPIRAGVCIEGVQLGRLSISSIGMMRGEVSCTVPEQYDWSRFGTTSAILTLNEIINRILEIPVPRRPRTSVVLGAIRGGSSFNTIAKQATLSFEIRSESRELVQDIARQMEFVTAEVASLTGSDVKLDIFASRQPGGVSFAHPLVESTRAIMQALDITQRIAPSTSELSAFIDKATPAITTGITTGDRLNEPEESVDIQPMFTGIAQIIGILMAIDGGFCDEA